MLGMIASGIGLRGFDPVNEADTDQEVEMPVNGKWGDLALLPILEQGDQFVGGNSSFGGQQLRLGVQSRRG